MKINIQNSSELQSEILRLRNLRFEIEDELLKETNKFTSKLRTPLILLSKLKAWFAPFEDNTNNSQNNSSGDWVSSAFRNGLPLLLDKFVFPKSGFIFKHIVQFLSQNAGKSLNKTVIADLTENLCDWYKSIKPRKKGEPKMVDYGIPTDSETY